LEDGAVEVAALLQEAQKAQQKSYSPYSRFKVGAALLGQSGQVYTGSNIENSSYGLKDTGSVVFTRKNGYLPGVKSIGSILRLPGMNLKYLVMIKLVSLCTRAVKRLILSIPPGELLSC
jgi:hypothetical protein